MNNYVPNDLRERITALIDGQITSESERSDVEAFLASSEEARMQQRVESALVGMLHERREALRERIPADVERRIRLALIEQPEASPSLWQRIVGVFARPLVSIPILATGIAVAAIFVVQQQPQVSEPSAVNRSPLVDLQAQAYANFESIVRGELTVAVASESEQEVRSWFKNNGVTYDVQFPSIEATLVGGVVSTHEHKKFAHLVYNVGNHLVYMFEVDEASLASRDVALDTGIVDGLAHGKWHWEERLDTGTLFIWKSNNVVCAAVSDLRTDELSALFDLHLL